MMKGCLLLILLTTLASCNVMEQMHAAIEESIDAITRNREMVDWSTLAIAENEEIVTQGNQTIRQNAEIVAASSEAIARNTELMGKVTRAIQKNHHIVVGSSEAIRHNVAAITASTEAIQANAKAIDASTALMAGLQPNAGVIAGVAAVILFLLIAPTVVGMLFLFRVEGRLKALLDEIRSFRGR